MSDEKRNLETTSVEVAGGTGVEIRRMLAAFKADLPPHELGYWYVTKQAVEEVIEDDSPSNTFQLSGLYDGYVRIRGHALCIRCGQRFDVPNIGNFTTSEERIGATVDNAKEWVFRIAARSGPCWGDVPNPDAKNTVSEPLVLMDARS